jgi:hypothetical protein
VYLTAIGGKVLTYLDALLDALRLRDREEIQRLLDHPLARILPTDAREEAGRFADPAADPLAAPLRVMRLRHQTAELLRDTPPVADREDSPEPTPVARRSPPALARRAPRLVQMELPLSA